MNLAHFHLILNHIPVLGGMATLALVILAAFKTDEVTTKLTLQFMVLIGILSLPVYFTGEPAEEVIEHLPGVTETFINSHEKYALFALISTELLAVIGAIGLFFMKKYPKKVKDYWMSIGVVALMNAMLMMATANLGGEIRHTEIRKNPEAASPAIVSPPSREDKDH